MQVPFEKCLHGCRLNFPDWLLPLTFLFSTPFYLVCLELVAQSFARLWVSVLHDHNSHAGNCIGLPSNTALFLFTGKKYLFLFQRHIIPCDSWPLLLFRFSHIWRQNFAIKVSDLYFSSPLSSTSDNWASISSDKFPCRTILIRFPPSPHEEHGSSGRPQTCSTANASPKKRTDYCKTDSRQVSQMWLSSVINRSVTR